jgi:hypothetical protein
MTLGRSLPFSVLTVLGCAVGATALGALAARPTASRTVRPTYGFWVAPMLPPAIVGVRYPPKPYTTVSVCRPVAKSGKPCGAWEFTVARKPGALPAGLALDAADGVLGGTAAWQADVVQPYGSPSTGLYHFVVCGRERGKYGAICKPTKLAVFTGLAGTWTGQFQGDPVAFTCATPPSGTITLDLTQKVAYTNDEAHSTVAGAATLSNLPPISSNGVQTGDCRLSTQSFTVTGMVVNPSVSGTDSANGLWNANLTSDGKLTGSLTVQDSGNHGYYSRLSFTLTRSSPSPP